MAHPSPAPLPGRSYYGFVAYTLASLAMPAYVCWALVPHHYLEALGVTYMPHRLWALLFPALLVSGLLVFVACVYPALNWRLTLSTDDPRCVYPQLVCERARSDLFCF